MKEKILFVDDDENILNAYRRVFWKDFSVITVSSGEQALELIDKGERYPIIISDMRMSGMNGIQFLSSVKQKLPDSVRIMITGHADQQLAIDAVNEGNIFRFLTKPCPAEVLTKAIAAGLQQYRLLQAEKELLAQTLEGNAKILKDLFAERQQAELQRCRLEEQLYQAQKMEAIGRLAGGVAHDFNNLLVAINGYSELLINGLDVNNQLRSYAEEVLKAGERAAALTKQLLTFSRKQVIQPKALDLNSIVSGMIKMLIRLIGEDINLTFSLDPQLGQVHADSGQIEQILLNLAVNSRDAMPQGGQLLIETANVELTKDRIGEFRHLPAGPYVLLKVADTGCGMDSETQAHIFEPFFTTKESGVGTGLGLSTVYGIVEQNGGEIQVQSTPGKGTTFYLYLPRISNAATEQMEITPDKLLSGTETVLVVEDDESVRRMTRNMLQQYGYQVLEAATITEARLHCEQAERKIHLMITDIVMPQLSGCELAASLASLQPDMQVIYVSGYTNNILAQHGLFDTSVSFLQKPFSAKTLALKVREVLDSSLLSQTANNFHKS